MNSNNKTGFQEFAHQTEIERNLNQVATYKKYKNGNQQEKQEYWNEYIFSMYFHYEGNAFPIKIQDFREEHKELETDFERFIPGIIRSLRDFGYTIQLEDIFILDEQAKKALKSHSVIDTKPLEVNNILEE
ncbi:hypothetical protein CSB09_01695 [Candidatus Gracilibacteria bacterium]|nr:MAG: hypothetical protein CSB09_01695 [Candidatus Gracilibacteria bacterium]